MHVVSLVVMLSLLTVVTHAVIVKEVPCNANHACQNVTSVTRRHLQFYLDPHQLRSAGLCAE